MVTITKMESQHLDRVKKLSVAEAQEPFVGLICDILDRLNQQTQPYLVLADGKIVGFFLIDRDYKSSYHDASVQSLGLRKFFIDQAHQGQGYAKQALLQLADLLRAEYPDYKDIYLTVNCKNSGAKSLYLKVGFKDSGALYLGGPSGPQHVLKQELMT
ncbi:GNAT family N-acetyltransferase [Marinomonas pollencensis]|uniref:Acetyltransferase (GNAT) family protein n=1 Tax=Marinomonas pollencensis TaxID=491954 RepID=A0A3E0DPZ8_9GAMM|nr:GNAT family N-acetyltransferase [Marinomonas pollencensis]REG84949.1 acetyltransferase (GNAT) family protein [Marinomonas pollencensis]